MPPGPPRVSAVERGNGVQRCAPGPPPSCSRWRPDGPPARSHARLGYFDGGPAVRSRARAAGLKETPTSRSCVYRRARASAPSRRLMMATSKLVYWARRPPPRRSREREVEELLQAYLEGRVSRGLLRGSPYNDGCATASGLISVEAACYPDRAELVFTSDSQGRRGGFSGLELKEVMRQHGTNAACASARAPCAGMQGWPSRAMDSTTPLAETRTLAAGDGAASFSSRHDDNALASITATTTDPGSSYKSSPSAGLPGLRRTDSSSALGVTLEERHRAVRRPLEEAGVVARQPSQRAAPLRADEGHLRALSCGSRCSRKAPPPSARRTGSRARGRRPFNTGQSTKRPMTKWGEAPPAARRPPGTRIGRVAQVARSSSILPSTCVEINQ